eukprot:TRINITY_DN6081_c0_g1_i1.p1 TRINITY_DN6081_c0_g1~~TRINITY_DN6081_c0_g1_i1.p1  ORF type:complete len:538 (+),score=64.11 TRINITY_DN6081_c0_g1_i1:35-1648(+)
MANSHIIRSPYADLNIPSISLGEFMLQHLAAHPPNRVALVDANTDESWTYGELVKCIERLGLHFAEMGMTKGIVTAIYAPNHPFFPIIFQAIALIGATSTTCNPLYTPGELNNQLKDSGASFIIATEEGLDKVKEAVALLSKQHPERQVKILTFEPAKSDGKPLDSVRELLQRTTKSSKLPKVQIDPANDIVTIPYSSGTTGHPKGVVLTHTNLVANILQTYHFDVLKEGDCSIAVLPFFHVYGLTVIMNVLFFGGAKIVVMSKFDLLQYLQLIQKHKPTMAHVVPPIVLALAKHPIIDKFDLSSIRVFFSGAAPLGAELQKEAEQRIKTGFFKQGYGMSELSPVSHVNPNDRIKYGSVGVLAPNCIAKIVDENGKPVPTGASGEMLIKGPNVMKGYLNNPKATAHTIDKDGFLHTGDVAVVDEDGYFYIVDRVKELIKFKGFQVPPAELEAILVTHPAVADAAVVPVPDIEAGELPRAFIVLKPNAKISESEIAKWLEDRVAPHKKLRGGIIFIDSIPKTASGKILRRVLVQHAKL